MAATTWRIGQIDVRGEDLTLAELRLHGASGAVDSGATVTSSHAPTAGTLANLIDGNPATTCTFAAADVRSPGFWIQWVLPGAQDVRWFRASGASTLRRAAMMTADGAFDALAVVGVGYQDLVPYPMIEAHLSLSPVAAWALDESGATQTDLVGTNDGARTGGVIGATQMFMSNTVAFDPQTTGLVRAAAGSFDTGSFSVVFDFKSTDFANKVVIEHGVGNAGWTVQIPPSNTGQLQFLVGGVANPVLTNAVISDGLVHRIVCTYSPSKGRAIYVDGMYDVLSWLPVGGAPSYGNNFLDIGSSAGTFGPAAGSALSNVAIFNRELTPTEVRRLQGFPLTYDTTRDEAELFLATGTPPQTLHMDHLADAEKPFRDMEFSGTGVITGTVKRESIPSNIPMRRRVRLHRDIDGVLVRETWSDPVTGAYQFNEISTQYRYTVITYDYEHNYRAVIADNLQAVIP